MRRVNLRFLGIVLLCTLVLAGTVHAIHVYQFSKHVKFLRQMADSAAEQGNVKTAIAHYRRYLTLSQDDADAFARLGTLLADSNQLRQARLPLSTAIALFEGQASAEAQARIPELRRRLAQVCLDDGRFTDAEHQLNLLLADNPSDAELLEQRGLARAGQARWSTAVKDFTAAVEADPARFRAYAALADAYMSRLNESTTQPVAEGEDQPAPPAGGAREAVRTLHEMVDRNPDAGTAYLIRGSFRLRYLDDENVRQAEAERRAGQSGGQDAQIAPLSTSDLLELATADARRAAELSPNEIDTLLLAMECAHRNCAAASPDEVAGAIEEAKRYAEQVIQHCANEVEQRIAELQQREIERLNQQQQQQQREKGKQPAGDDPPQRDDSPDPEPSLSDEAKRKIEREVFVTAVPAYNVLADIAIREGDLPAALRALNDGLARVEYDESLLLNLAKLRLSEGDQQGEDAELDRLIQELRNRPRTEPLADFLEAQRDVVRGEWRKAANVLRRVRQQLTEWPQVLKEADLWLGTCYMELGLAAEARQAYERVLVADPRSLAGHFAYATALEAAGDYEGALQRYLQLHARRGELSDFAGWNELSYRIVRLMVARNRNRDPADPVWTQILDHLRDNRANAGDSPGALALLDTLEAEVHLARRQADKAEEVLRSGVERDPKSGQLWAALITVQSRSALTAAEEDQPSRWEVARETVSKALEATREAAPLERVRVELARLQQLLLQDDPDVKSAIQQKAEEALAWPTETGEQQSARLRLLEGVADFCRYVEDVETAFQLYQEVREQDRNNIRVRIALLDLLLELDPTQVGETDLTRMEAEVDSLLDEVGNLEGQGPLWNYGQAAKLAKQLQQLKQSSSEEQSDAPSADELATAALEHLDRAAAVWRDWGRVPFLRGRIHAMLGDEQNAMTAYLEAFRRGYRPAEWAAGLVVELYQQGRYIEAGEILMTLSEVQVPHLAELAQVAIAVSNQVPDDTQSQDLTALALRFAENAAQTEDDVAAHLAYGQLLLIHGETEKAQQELQRVRELAPTTPLPWLTLLAIQVQLGNTEAVEQTLEAARQALEEPHQTLFAARACEMLNDRDGARSHYERGLAALPAELRQANAGQIELLSYATNFFLHEGDERGEALLRRIIDEGGELWDELRQASDNEADDASDDLERAVASAVPAARRRQVALLIGRPKIANLQAALKLVEANYEDRGRLSDDERLEALVLSRWPTRQVRLKAVGLLEQLISNASSPRNEDRLLLATIYLGEYQREKARSQRRQASSQSEPAQLNSSALQQLNAAREQLQAIVLSSRAQSRSGGGEVRTADGTYVSALVAYIGLLLDSQELSDADHYLGMLKAANPGSPGTVMTEVRVLNAQGRHDQARQVLAEFVGSATPESLEYRITQAAQLLENFGTQAAGQAGSASVAESYFAESERLLVQLAEKGPDQQLALASYFARRGRIEEALNLIATHQSAASPTALARAGASLLANVRDDAVLARLADLLSTSLEQHPDSVPLQLTLADLLAWRGELTAAEELYRRVLAAVPAHAVAANNLAYLLSLQHGRTDEALKWINVAIEQEGELPDLLDTRAFVHLQRREPDAALADLNKAMAESTQPVFLFHAAQASLAAGKSPAAKALWSEAILAGLNENGIHPAEREAFTAFKRQIQMQ